MCRTRVHARVNTDTNKYSCMHMTCSRVIHVMLLNMRDQYMNNFDTSKHPYLTR
jgi:hypothetical protein